MINTLLISIQQGLIVSLSAYAVMIPFRILNFHDISLEGTYPLAGTVYGAVLILGKSPIIALLAALIAAGLASVLTGVIQTFLSIPSLLAGIIVSTMLYSINLRVLGVPNKALFDLPSLLPSTVGMKVCALGLLICIITTTLYLFLYTQAGLRMRAVGFNQACAQRLNISVTLYTLMGLFIAGCYAGLSASLMVQTQQYVDIGMGFGIVINGLSAVMIGEALLGTHSLLSICTGPLAGALVYQQIQRVVMQCGLAPSDLKLFTGIIILCILGYRKIISPKISSNLSIKESL